MNEARSSHTQTLLSEGTVLVTGGYGFSVPFTSLPSASAEVRDPLTGTWRRVNLMTAPRALHTATLLANGKVLIVGGLDSNSQLSSAELYDPSQGTWTRTGTMLESRYRHSATLLPNGMVLVAGGVGSLSNTLVNLRSAELYDPSTGGWTPTSTMLDARSAHTATLLRNGKVLVVGGDKAELYDPVAGSWKVTRSLSKGRSFHTATLLADGKVLVAGGVVANQSVSDVELYNPGTEIWSVTTAMFINRRNHTATLLPNGKVLVAGGSGGFGSIPSAELYDPGIGLWAAISPMSESHANHAATQLGDGNVLITGGTGGSHQYPLAITELFDSSTASEPPPNISLLNPQKLPSGAFAFQFSNAPGVNVRVFATTNLSSPFTDWTQKGMLFAIVPGRYDFTDLQATNGTRRFYSVRSP